MTLESVVRYSKVLFPGVCVFLSSPLCCSEATLCEKKVAMGITRESKYKQNDDGRMFGGKVDEFLDTKLLRPLALKVEDNKCPLECILDYDGHRYFLLLKHNVEDDICIENVCLRQVEVALNANVDGGPPVRNAIAKCLDLFWPFAAEDTKLRNKEGDGKRASEELCIQLKSVEEKIFSERLVIMKELGEGSAILKPRVQKRHCFKRHILKF